MRVLTLFFISFLFYSCDKKKEDEVVLELKNTNLNYSIFGSDPNNALLRLDLKIQELTK